MSVLTDEVKPHGELTPRSSEEPRTAKQTESSVPALSGASPTGSSTFIKLHQIPLTHRYHELFPEGGGEWKY